MSGLVKMILTAYKDGKFSEAIPGCEYKVMINPEKIKIDDKISHNDNNITGSGSDYPTFNYTNGSELNFELVIDCTGVVDGKRLLLPVEIELLKSVVYNYNGEIHRSNYVVIQWGISTEFKGVLSSLTTEYTYFNSLGLPLRAKVSLSFKAYKDPELAAIEENRQSPDMTHFISVTQGDTLPNLSYQTYSDSSYYVKLARFNGLNKFRNIKSVKNLIFPPILQDK